MIRRLVVLVAVTVGSLVGFAGIAHASNGNIVCAYEADPLHVGVCIGV